MEMSFSNYGDYYLDIIAVSNLPSYTQTKVYDIFDQMLIAIRNGDKTPAKIYHQSLTRVGVLLNFQVEKIDEKVTDILGENNGIVKI